MVQSVRCEHLAANVWVVSKVSGNVVMMAVRHEVTTTGLNGQANHK